MQLDIFCELNCKDVGSFPFCGSSLSCTIRVFQMNFLINYLWYLAYLVVLTEGTCSHNREGTVIHTVLGSVPLGDDFLSVLITPHTYSSIELLTSTCRSKDMYTLPMTFYDPFVLLDGHFSGMGHESWFSNYWKSSMWTDLIKEWVKNNNW